MPPHAHGGGDEEEEIIVRTDGPPFADIKAKHVSHRTQNLSFLVISVNSHSSLLHTFSSLLF